MTNVAQRLLARIGGTSPTAQRIFGATMWAAAGDGASRIMILLSFVCAARILGSHEYGQFGLVRSTILMFTNLGGLGLGLTANRYLAQYYRSDSRFCGQVIGSSYVLAIWAGLVITTALLLLSGDISSKLLTSPDMQRSFRIGSLAMLFSTVMGAQIGILQGLHAYRQLALGNFILGALGVAFVVGGAFVYRVDGAIAGLVVQQALACGFFAFLINREARQQSIDRYVYSLTGLGGIFWSFSLPVALMSICIAPFKWFGETIVAQRAGFGELGIFHGAMAVSSVLIAVSSTINAPLISIASQAVGDKHAPTEKAQYFNLYGSWFLFLVFSLPFLLLPGLAPVFFGATFATVSFQQTNLLLLTYSALLIYYQGITRLMTLSGGMWLGFATNLIEGIALLVAIWFLAHEGASGLAKAFVISYLVRIAFALPLVVRGRLVTVKDVFDRNFLISAFLFVVLVVIQYRAL